MEKRSKKMKAGIAMVTAIVLAMVGFISSTSAHPPQPQTPGVAIPSTTGNVTVSFSAVDVGGSGIDNIRYSMYYQATLGSAPNSSAWTLTVSERNYTGAFTVNAGGYYQVHFYSRDKAGNLEAEKFKTFRLIRDHNAGTTTILLVSDGMWITPYTPD